MDILKFLEIQLYGNSLMDWGISIAVAIAAYLGFFLIQRIGLNKLKKLPFKRRVNWMKAFFEALANTKWFILLILSVYIGMRGLEFSPPIEKNASLIAFSAFFIQLGLWGGYLLNAWASSYRERQIKINPGAVTTLGTIKFIVHGLIWLSIFLLVLENIGFDITALIAGLGIGGIAVALAVQNILGDLFASLSIILDKTFVVGDFITVDNYLGSVESIGMKTTRIRSLSGEQIIFANSDLLGGRIRNYGRMYERRALFSIGVTYQTPRKKLQKIPQIIREAIESQENTRFDRAHFLKYGESSLDFEYVYYVLSPDYNTYMDIQQNINFILHEEFENQGIDFAYPTRTLFIEGGEKAA